MEESTARTAVLVPSDEMPENATSVKGYDFNQGIDFNALLESYFTTGFQATQLGRAIAEINRMVNFFI